MTDDWVKVSRGWPKHGEFATIDDVRTWYLNSGILDWDWCDGFREDVLIAWIYRNAPGRYPNQDAAIAGFLEDMGEDPADYGLDVN